MLRSMIFGSGFPASSDNRFSLSPELKFFSNIVLERACSLQLVSCESVDFSHWIPRF